MKKYKVAQKIIKELEEIGIISIACKKVGLSRQSFYRWTKEDPDFADKIDVAMQMGVDSVNDLSESKLIANINSGNQKAIEFQLRNNHPRYKLRRPDTPSERELTPVTYIIHKDFDNDKILKNRPSPNDIEL